MLWASTKEEEAHNQCPNYMMISRHPHIHIDDGQMYLQ